MTDMTTDELHQMREAIEQRAAEVERMREQASRAKRKKRRRSVKAARRANR